MLEVEAVLLELFVRFLVQILLVRIDLLQERTEFISRARLQIKLKLDEGEALATFLLMMLQRLHAELLEEVLGFEQAVFISCAKDVDTRLNLRLLGVCHVHLALLVAVVRHAQLVNAIAQIALHGRLDV